MDRSITIRRVDRYNYDLFQGEGWDNWSRICRGKENTFVKRGLRVHKNLLETLHEVLNPRFPINYGESLTTTINNLNAIEK